MSDRHNSVRQWILRMQSAFVLPLARGIYLLVALACLLTVIGGVLFVVFLQASTLGQPSMKSLPPPYQATSTFGDLPPREIDVAVIEERLAAPDGLQFAVTIGIIKEPLTTTTVLGYFQVPTLNQLAPFPDGVSLLGGSDAHLFERVPGARNQPLIGLAPRPALVAEIEQALQDITEVTTRSFEVRAIARDEYGITSAPMDVSFDLTFAPPEAAPTAASDAMSEVGQDMTELEKIARLIAQTLEPEVNPAQFAAYRTALQVPSRCRAQDDDDTFLANYRAAFDNVQSRINSTTIDAFYQGLCEAWEALVKREAAAREQAEQQQRSARRAADEARAQVEASNRQAAHEYQAKVNWAKSLTAVTFSVIGGALAMFLSVALLLAFLAIEGHSRAMRAAVESIVKLTEQRESRAEQPSSTALTDSLT